MEASFVAETGERRQSARRERVVQCVGTRAVSEKDDDGQMAPVVVCKRSERRKLASVHSCLNPVNSTHA